MAGTNKCYTNKDKIRAVNVAKETSFRAAEQKTGIPEANIRRWSKDIQAIADAPRNSRVARVNRRLHYPEQETELQEVLHIKYDGWHRG